MNTVGTKRTLDEDGAIIRSSAIEHGVPLFTALDTVDAMIRVLESRGFTNTLYLILSLNIYLKSLRQNVSGFFLLQTCKIAMLKKIL